MTFSASTRLSRQGPEVLRWLLLEAAGMRASRRPATHLDHGENLGDDLAIHGSAGRLRLTHTNALTSINSGPGMSWSLPDLVRDEEVVGSNPTTQALGSDDPKRASAHY